MLRAFANGATGRPSAVACARQLAAPSSQRTIAVPESESGNSAGARSTAPAARTEPPPNAKRPSSSSSRCGAPESTSDSESAPCPPKRGLPARPSKRQRGSPDRPCTVSRTSARPASSQSGGMPRRERSSRWPVNSKSYGPPGAAQRPRASTCAPRSSAASCSNRTPPASPESRTGGSARKWNWLLATSAELSVIHHVGPSHAAWPVSVRLVSPACAVSGRKRTTWSPSASGPAARSKWTPRNEALAALACAVRSGLGSSRPRTPPSVHWANAAEAQRVSRPARSPVTNSAPPRLSTLPSAWSSTPVSPEARPSGHSSSGRSRTV